MLRVHFTDRDLSRVRMADSPNPLWETVNSVLRLQGRLGRTAYAPWIRDTREKLAESGLTNTVRSLLFPLLPVATYFPDFLTPFESSEGLDAGIDAILRTPRQRVSAEVGALSTTPAWARRLPDGDIRADLGSALRAYHRHAIEPHLSTIRTALDGDRAVRTRALLSGGVDGLLDSFRPVLRWRSPVLEADYPVDLDIRLNGRGLLLIPSYFCWERPVALADPDLPPVLVYPIPRTEVTSTTGRTPVAALLGATRAAVLRATASGFTTGEIARIVGVSAATASHHLNVLRDCALITSHRQSATVLHVLTPLGADLLKPTETPNN